MSEQVASEVLGLDETAGDIELELAEKNEEPLTEHPVPPAAAAIAHPSVPDGGLRAWATVAGAWFVSACTFGYINAYGVYQTYYIEALLPSYSSSAISWIGSLQIFLLMSMGIVTGRLFDKGYFRHLMIVGSVLYVGCLFAQSAAQQDGYYQILLSQGLGQGMAQGLIYLPSLGVMSHHFRKRRVFAMGLAISGSSVGGIVFPIMLNNLLEKNGYRWAVRAAGFFMLGALLLANLLMTTRLPPQQHTAKVNLKGFARDPPYLFAIAGAFLIGWGIFFPFFYIQLFTTFRGMSQEFSFYTLAIINGASVLGRTLPNLLADHLGPLTLLAPASMFTGVLTFAVLGLKSVPGVVIFCLLYGFFSGAYVSLMGPMFIGMSDHMYEIGVRMGIAFSFVGVAALTGTPIDGALLGQGYAWWRAVIFSGIAIMLGASSLGLSWVLLRRKKGKLWV